MPTSGSGTGLITLEPGCQPVVVVHARLHWNLDATSGSGTGLITLEPGCQPVVVVQA